jgi:type VI secretion system FHA domain protein
MSIILNVETYKGQPPIEPMIITFDQKGGTIGRSKKNNFVLPDPDRYISRQHAAILYENGVYFLKDNSLSGSYIRSRRTRVHNNKAELLDGDLIEIGEYLISVDLDLLEDTEYVSDIEQIEEDDHLDADNEMELSAYEEVKKSGVDTDAGADDQKKYGDFEAVVRFVNEKMEEVSFHQELDSEKKQSPPYDTGSSEIEADNKLLKKEDEALQDNVDDKAAQIEDDEPFLNNEHNRILSDSQRELEFSGSDAEKSENDLEKPLLNIPAGIDVDKLLTNIQMFIKRLPSILPSDELQAFQTELSRSLGNLNGKADLIRHNKKTQPDPDRKSTCTHQSPDEVLHSFLHAAGIKDVSLFKAEEIPDLILTAGSIFRELIEGLVALITGRAETKKQLRLKGTILGPTDNNPLKFSSDIEDTIKILLDRRQNGFVSGIQAVRESYADIMSHQVAMTIGIQTALKKTLKRFDPKPYTRRYKKNPSFLQKSKCWDDYCKDYQTIVIKSLENFLDEEFIKAYEEQIEKLTQSTDDL